MRMTQEQPDADVEAWRAAYLAANGREPDVVPVFERGWVVWRQPSGIELHRRQRRSSLREMTKRLQERVKGRACQVCSPEPKDA